MRKYFLSIFVGALLFLGVSTVFNVQVKAEGTYHILGTPGSSHGSPDAVSWSTGNPLVVDAFGNYLAPNQVDASTDYNISFSNDKGATWTEVTNLSIAARVSMAYDSANDSLLILSAAGNGDIIFRRLLIKRDENYKIIEISSDTSFSNLLLDSVGSCISASAADPVILTRNVNGTNYALAFWATRKDCGVGQEFTETRASILPILNDSSDGNAAAWQSITGDASPASFGPAAVDFTTLYTTPSIVPNFQHSALIADSGVNQNDIYYFNIDENDTHGFIRFPFNPGINKWINPTSRQTFGGNVNDGQGYNLKRELLTKPVFASGQSRVYVGIARWLDNTNGDTQSLFYVDTDDSVNLAGNLYSAGGGHCLYPTLDISYDQVHDQVYSFYLTSGASNVCGHTDYKTFDGSTMSSASTFFSVDSRSVDIPITYPTRVDDKILLFFRVNNAVNAGTPPHDIYFGYVGLDDQSVPPSTAANGANSNNDFGFSDFIKTCSTSNGIAVTGDGIAALILSSSFRDEFHTPNSPYTYVDYGLWLPPSTWDPGIFEPKPNGQINVYSPNGAYILSRQQFSSPQTFQFRAKLGAYNYEHIGLANGDGFNKYAIFSTGNDGVLRARTSAGSESNTTLGTSYFDDFHDYIIVWDVSTVTFMIDGVQVASFSNDVPDEPMRIVLSNNDHTSGADLLVDSVNTIDFPGLNGTYTSCAIDSGITNAQWTTTNYQVNLLGGQSVGYQVRTSTDLITWSSWSSNLSSGATIPSPLGRYAQYKAVLTTNNANISPSFYDVTLNFIAPVSPDAVNDNVNTDQDTPFVIHLFANDLHIDNLDSDQTTLTSSALHGVANLVDSENGGVFYTPNLGYSGPDQFTYQICNPYALCDSATVNITVNPVYVGPTGNPESTTIVNNSNVEISVLSNDTDSDGTLDFTTLIVSIAPSHGNTSVNTTTGKITYTPNSGYVGADSFVYSICDNHDLCTTGTVTLTVSAPVVSNDPIINSPTQDENEVSDFTNSILSCNDDKPTTPYIVSALSSDLTQATIMFQKGIGAYTSFEVQISQFSNIYSDSDIISLDKSTFEYTFKNLLPNSTYYFRVREKNGCTVSEWSSEFKATTLSSTPVIQNVAQEINTNSTNQNSSDQPTLKPEYALIICCPSVVILIAILEYRRRKANREY